MAISEARGFIVIDKPEDYDLPKPYVVNIPSPGPERTREGPGYMMTVFHQLHCLSYLAEHYQQGYGGVNLTEEVAEHTGHCFNYLRQGIMCSADVTLEGETKEGPGEGSEHECVDYDALLEWANEHGAMPWRGTLPDTAVL
jgi:CTP-dependent riboflavin kinase